MPLEIRGERRPFPGAGGRELFQRGRDRGAQRLPQPLAPQAPPGSPPHESGDGIEADRGRDAEIGAQLLERAVDEPHARLVDRFGRQAQLLADLDCDGATIDCPPHRPCDLGVAVGVGLETPDLEIEAAVVDRPDLHP